MSIWLNNTDINEFDDALNLFDAAKAEDQQGPIAPGKYLARLVSGTLDKARTGNTCYRTTWEIVEGEFAERQIIHKYWFTPKAIGRAKAELTALGIGGEHLRGADPLPPVVAELSIVQRADETGDPYHEVRRIRPAAQTDMPAVNKTVPPATPPQKEKVSTGSVPEPALSTFTAREHSFVDNEFGEF